MKNFNCKVVKFYSGIYNVKIIYFVLVMNLVALSLYSQQKFEAGEIVINCDLPKIIRSNKDLKLKIMIINKSNKTLYFYDDLIEGLFNGSYILGTKAEATNLEFIVEKKSGKYFKEYSKRRHTDSAPSNDSAKIPSKIKLISGDSLVRYLHVDSRYSFERGDFRLRCLYWYDVRINNVLKSNWIYFHVEKELKISHDF